MRLLSKIVKDNGIAIIGLIICISIFLGSLFFYIEMNTSLKKTVIDINNVNYESEEAMRLLTLFKSTHPKYKTLKEQKIIGKDLRIFWLEKIQTTAQQMYIPSLDIEFSNIRESNYDKDLYSSDTLKLKVSENSMKFKLLHEGDFYMFFNTLRNKKNGLFDVIKCNLRIIDGTNFNSLENISSECHLKWYSFEDTIPAWKDNNISILKANN